MHILTLLLAAAFMMLLTACNDAPPRSERPDDMTAQTDTAALASKGPALARKIGLAFPATATYLFAAYEPGQDDNIRLVVDLPAADWATLSAKPPYAGADFAADNNHHLAPDDASGPWQPEKSAGLKTAQVPVRDGRESLNTGIVQQPDRVRLYIFWYQL